MSKFTTIIWGFNIEVEYDYTPADKGDRFTPPSPESVEVCEYKFIGETPDFEDDVDQTQLEEKIEEAIIEHERAYRAKNEWLKPYLTAKRMRNRDF